MNGRCRNIFVLGLDEEHLRDLENIPDRDRFRFHGLLDREEVSVDRDVDVMIDKAQAVLNAFDGPIDAIIGYWDFPVTAVAAILCRRFGLPSPSLEAVLRCAHKYWARLEQWRVMPECTPRFCAVNPFSDDPLAEVSIDFPFWLKPVCGYSSTLGFRINDERGFHEAIGLARERLPRFGDPFNAVLKRVDTSDLEGVGGNHMIAEAMMGGVELAPEGSIRQGKVVVHGVIDMVRAPNHKSFKDYRYPSIQPRRVQEQTGKLVERFARAIGYDNGCFNVEFFWDQDRDELHLIEFNARISQSHSTMMAMVDGMSNYEVAIHVALGDEPSFEHGGGPYPMAAKYLYRRFDVGDAFCISAPEEADLARLAEVQPDTRVSLKIHPGMRLSETVDQDAYSWVLADLVIGGEDVSDLNRQFEQAKSLLPFHFEPIDSISRQQRQGGQD
ncbi:MULTISPECIES: ATP-grasp domain-containing protein [unclassified Guyparkeria]|uniref:ATP-grasp domain-containing protein n=1 Tax=unclassified Guyparkeria TaxID=2626246 RepID=UPI00073368FB|nr:MULTISPECIES: ATP-grasp domain-containing protein [unclassified Guyparkeria]KTG17523.1 hypothetical protein AUR63_07655 [Guyparkeria sp. XI15]OAE88338.1 hypothetical protein AWR35_07670 [Guyparkeria sp. WRN-7]